MKTVLLSIACLLLSISTVFAQTISDFGSNYYRETETFVMNGYTYQCDVDQSTQFVFLYNKENKWTYADMVYKDTGEYYVGPQSARVNTIITDKEMTRKVYDIVDNAFTVDMVRAFGDSKLMATMFLDPESGKVAEVCFELTTFDPYTKVPVRIFRDIEMQLKAKISFTPTSIGKRLNYIMLSWSQLPKGNGIISTPPTRPNHPGGLKPNNNPDNSVVLP